tara:strand:- start:3306 stop:3518 length:213 start_codon:yes stop_codon:yes gene_type:complete
MTELFKDIELTKVLNGGVVLITWDVDGRCAINDGSFLKAQLVRQINDGFKKTFRYETMLWGEKVYFNSEF